VSPERAQKEDLLSLRERIAHLERENARLRAEAPRLIGLDLYDQQFRYSQVPSFIHHRGKIIYANAAVAELLGAESPDPLIGRSPLDIIDPAFHSVVLERVQFLYETNHPLVPLEENYRRMDGTSVPVLASAWLVPYQNELAMHVSLLDLSCQKDAEQKLLSSLDLIDSILEATPDLIFVKDANGRYVHVNSAAAQAMGLQKADMIGKTTAELIPQQYRDAVLAVDRRVLTTGITEVVEEEVPFRGGVRTYLATKSARRGLHGEIAGVVVLARDISSRKEAERERDRHRERLQMALEAGQMGTWDFEVATGKLVWSDNHFRLFGLEPNSCVPTAELFSSRIHPADRADFDAVINAAMANHQDYSVQYRVIWPDGTEHWLEARGRVSVQGGKPTGTVGVVTDVTDRKRTEDRLREAAKLESLGILAGGIAHDFNNLLTGMVGNASLIHEEAAPGSEIARWAKGVVDASERAASLTRQMLAYSGRGHFVIEPVDFSHEVAAITALLKASIPKQVNLFLDLGTNLSLVDADKGQLQQVVMNLVLNAAEAARPDRGSVQLRTFAKTVGKPDCPQVDRRLTDRMEEDCLREDRLTPGEYVALEVRDDGVGMTPEVRERIFEPFFTTKFTGRGLGLAAVLGIVRGHKGVIRVDSTPEAGTLFTVLFPASAAHRTKEAESAPKAKPARGGELVLIVDDEEIVQKVAVTALQRRGFRTVTANNGSEAIDVLQARAGEISVVLLDMMMPVMGGVEALKHLRQIREETIFIATSGYPENDALKQFGARISGYIQKPYAASTLVRLVEDVIERNRK
jgi:two-component system, cell cycle sensor histidine kinase and response regulator CckA